MAEQSNLKQGDSAVSAFTPHNIRRGKKAGKAAEIRAGRAGLHKGEGGNEAARVFAAVHDARSAADSVCGGGGAAESPPQICGTAFRDNDDNLAFQNRVNEASAGKSEGSDNAVSLNASVLYPGENGGIPVHNGALKNSASPVASDGRANNKRKPPSQESRFAAQRQGIASSNAAADSGGQKASFGSGSDETNNWTERNTGGAANTAPADKAGRAENAGSLNASAQQPRVQSGRKTAASQPQRRAQNGAGVSGNANSAAALGTPPPNAAEPAPRAKPLPIHPNEPKISAIRGITGADMFTQGGLPSLHIPFEPAYLADLFFRFPPRDFTAYRAENGLPLFSCLFNLLTTLEPEQLRRLKAHAFYPRLARFLSYRTLFVGTTVSEFTPLPQAFSANAAQRTVAKLLRQAKKYPFLIVKDLPREASSLISADLAAETQSFDRALAAKGFMSVEGQALAYVPVDYADVDEYIARFSKTRRKDFRRKMKAGERLKIDILYKGDAAFYDETQLAEYYRLYEQVYWQSEVHFDFLSPDFFKALLQEAGEDLRFMTYRDEAGRLVGYNICFIVGDRLVDKYIGLDYPAATDYSLYFVSWFFNLSYARQQGLAYYIAGWTDPQVKAYLGAKFVMTRHRVYVRNPLLRTILRPLRPLFESDAAAAAGGATADDEGGETRAMRVKKKGLRKWMRKKK